jgi:hypothetical protein
MNQVPFIIVRSHCRLRLHNSQYFILQHKLKLSIEPYFFLNQVNPNKNNVTHTQENTHKKKKKKLTKAFQTHTLSSSFVTLNVQPKKKNPSTTTRVSPQMQILFDVISKKIN